MPDRAGSPTSRAAPGPAPRTPTARPASGTCTCSRPSSRTSTGTTPTSGASTRTSCASGSTAASPASASTPRRCSSRTRRCPRSRPTPGPGEHPHVDRDELHDIYRGWRAVADSYAEPRVLVGEVWLAGPRAVRPVPAPRRDAHGVQLRLHGPPLGRQGSCASRSRRRSPRTPPSAPPPPGCCPTTTSPGPSPATAARTASFAFAAKRFGTPTDLAARHAPGPGRRPARRRAARLAVRLPGRRARPARGRGPARWTLHPGPDALPLRGRRPRPRRLPRPAAVDARRGPAFGFGPDGGARPWLPQPAGWGELSVEAQADDPTPRCSASTAASCAPPRRAGAAATDFAWRGRPDRRGDDDVLAFARGDDVAVRRQPRRRARPAARRTPRCSWRAPTSSRRRRAEPPPTPPPGSAHLPGHTTGTTLT